MYFVNYVQHCVCNACYTKNLSIQGINKFNQSEEVQLPGGGGGSGEEVEVPDQERDQVATDLDKQSRNKFNKMYLSCTVNYFFSDYKDYAF